VSGEGVRGQIAECIDGDKVEKLCELLSEVKGLVKVQAPGEHLVIRCIERAALKCLREIVRRYGRGLRESMVGDPERCSIQIGAELTLKFDNEGFAALALNPTSHLLGFLLNQDGFLPTHQDYQSLLCALSSTSPSTDHGKRQSSCLSLLLASYRMHVVYASLPFARKLALLRTLVRQSHFSVELVARPYLKELVYLVAFEGEEP
jgi:hypothetical protein